MKKVNLGDLLSRLGIQEQDWCRDKSADQYLEFVNAPVPGVGSKDVLIIAAGVPNLVSQLLRMSIYAQWQLVGCLASLVPNLGESVELFDSGTKRPEARVTHITASADSKAIYLLITR